MAKTLTNWAGNVTFGASFVHRPTSLDQLREIVAGRPRVRALGSGHSFSRVADTDAELVRLDAIAAEVTIPAHGTAIVPAGMRYSDVASALHSAGWALANLASLPHISVAGSVSTGTHGSGDTLQSLAGAVTGVEMVGADGSLNWVTRRGDPATFPGMVVCLGALGITTRLELAVEPAFDVSQTVRTGVPLDRIGRELEAIFASAYSSSVFTKWADGDAMVWQKKRADDPRPDWVGGVEAVVDLHPITGFDPADCTPQLGVVGAWHERLPHFLADHTPSTGHEIQSEFLLHRADTPAALDALRPLSERIAEVLHVTELRSVRADDLWLSPFYRRNSIGLHFTWFDDMARVLPVLRAVEERLADFGPRPHWGKLTTMAPELVRGQYPKAPDFAALAHRLDPQGKFSNSYVCALFGTANDSRS